MAQYLKINYDGNKTTNVPTKSTLDEIIKTIPDNTIYTKYNIYYNNENGIHRFRPVNTGLIISAQTTEMPTINLSLSTLDEDPDNVISWYFAGRDFRPSLENQTIGQGRALSSITTNTLKSNSLDSYNYTTIHSLKAIIPDTVSSTMTLGNSTNPWYSVSTQRLFVYNENKSASGACSVYLNAPNSSSNNILTYSPEDGTADQYLLGINWDKQTNYWGTIQLGNFTARTTVCATDMLRFAVRDKQGSSNSRSIIYNYSSLYPQITDAIDLGTTSNLWNWIYAQGIQSITTSSESIVRHLVSSQNCFTEVQQNLASSVTGGGSSARVNITVETKFLNQTNTTRYGLSVAGNGGYNAGVYRMIVRPYSNIGISDLGSEQIPWNTIYATSGVVQTSDRALKHDIHYLSNNKENNIQLFSSQDINDKDYSIDDIISFVKNIKPVIFTYGTTIQEDLETVNKDKVQLGLIADDISDDKMFNFLGLISETKNENNGETVVRRGLKHLPLITAALTACKYLLEQNEKLIQDINDIKERLL